MKFDDEQTAKRVSHVIALMNERLRSMSPQERDRTMQVHLAQARGPVRNVNLLCQMTSMLLHARQTACAEDRQDV